MSVSYLSIVDVELSGEHIRPGGQKMFVEIFDTISELLSVISSPAD